MDDLNRLIVKAQEMGFMDSLFDKNVANSTKCTTWKQVQESHTISNEDIGMRWKDLRGMLIALASGLSSALFMFMTERLMHCLKSLCDEVASSLILKICFASVFSVYYLQDKAVDYVTTLMEFDLMSHTKIGQNSRIHPMTSKPALFAVDMDKKYGKRSQLNLEME